MKKEKGHGIIYCYISVFPAKEKPMPSYASQIIQITGYARAVLTALVLLRWLRTSGARIYAQL